MGGLIVALALWIAEPAVDPPGAAPAEVQAEYDAAVALRRERRFRESAAAFEALAERHPSRRLASLARIAAASLWRWQLAEPRRALQHYRSIALGPERVPGKKAALIGWLSMERDAGGPRGELRLIERLHRRDPGAEYAPMLLLRAARILAGELGRPAEALEPLEALRRAHRRSTWSGEAALLEARTLVRLGRPAEAVKVLRRLLATRRESFVVGEYDPASIDDGWLLLGEILERELKRPAEAAAVYRELIAEKPESRLSKEAAARLDHISGLMKP
jgi:tetratricopeptide (TPR) repeat protein